MHDFGYNHPREDFDVRIEDGRTIHFEDSRQKKPYYCKYSFPWSDSDGEDAVRTYYTLEDTDGMRSMLGDKLDARNAEDLVVEYSANGCVLRYTRDPYNIPELNMKPKKVREKGYCPFCGNNVKASDIGGRPCCPDCGSSLMPPVSRRGRR